MRTMCSTTEWNYIIKIQNVVYEFTNTLIFYLCGGLFFPKIEAMKELNALNIIKYAVYTALLVSLFILFPSAKASAAEADPYSIITSFASANGKDVFAVSAGSVPGTYSTITEAAACAKKETSSISIPASMRKAWTFVPRNSFFSVRTGIHALSGLKLRDTPIPFSMYPREPSAISHYTDIRIHRRSLLPMLRV